MNLFSRRSFCAAAAGGASLSCSSPAPRSESQPASQPGAGDYPKNLGVQLYTVRNIIREHPKEVLRELADIGYTEAEVISTDLDMLAPILKEVGIRAVAAHFPAPVLLDQWKALAKSENRPKEGAQTLAAAIEKAQRFELSYLVVPYLRPDDRGKNIAYYKEMAEQLNQAGEKIRKAGLRLAYHNHAFEFEPMEGSSPFQTIAATMDPSLFQWELDVFWVSVAGHDPVEVIRDQKGRISLMHLKDKETGFPTQYQEGVPAQTFKEVGNGSLDFAAILAAGRDAGVEHYFVEQDQSADPVASLKQSYGNLRRLSVPL